MAKYLGLEDVVESDLTIEERHLDSADVYVNALLVAKGVNPDDVEATPLLKEIARLTVLKNVYIEQQGPLNNNQDQFLFFEKAKRIDEALMPLLAALSRDTLGMASPPNRISFELL